MRSEEEDEKGRKGTERTKMRRKEERFSRDIFVLYRSQLDLNRDR